MTTGLRLTLVLGLLAGAKATTLPAQGPPPPPPPLAPLPPPPVPPENPITTAKANLGKILFWEEQLSSTGTVSCGTCHQPARGGSDPRSTIPGLAIHPGPDGTFGNADDIIGSPGVPRNLADGSYEFHPQFGLDPQVTGRKAISYLNAAYPTSLFWDGRATGTFRDPITNSVLIPAGGQLESQAAGPPQNDGEMSHVGRDWSAIAARIEGATPLALSPDQGTFLAGYVAGRGYGELFEEAFGTPGVTPARIIMAIATHERNLNTDQTPLDIFLRGGAQLTAQEMRGLNVFRTKNCITCHNGALMSDNQFHYIGVRPAGEDIGREEVTGNPANRGQFRTPGLRNVAMRGPYMHNGRFNTLEEVVDFYNRGGDFDAPNKAPQIVPQNINPGERADLLAFLRRPLIDPRASAEIAPFDRPQLYGESDRVPVYLGPGVPGTGGITPVAVAIEPPLAGNPSFTVAVTDALGGAEARLVIDDADPFRGRGDQPFATATITLSGSGAGSGHGSASINIAKDGSLIGRTFHGRWFITDPEAEGGTAVSQQFAFTIFGTAEAPQPRFTGFAVY